MNHKCPCGFESDSIRDLIWTKLKDRLGVLCVECADIIHKRNIAEGVE